jgi:hypothetical protein
MIGRTIAMLITIAFLTVAGVTVLGRLWRFVLIRPPGPTGPQSVVRRIVVLPPGPRDFAEQEARLVRFDLPFTVVFLAGSLYLLAMPVIGVTCAIGRRGAMAGIVSNCIEYSCWGIGAWLGRAPRRYDVYGPCGANGSGSSFAA